MVTTPFSTGRSALIRLRTAACALVLFATAAPLLAQAKLPKEEELNPLGLTMMWWGQSTVDRSRDRIEFVTADEQNVYIQSTSGVITTFSVETGERRWSRLLGKPDRVGYPAVTNDSQFLISVGRNIFSLDKMKGDTLWELQAPDLPSASPAVDDDRVYIGTVDGSVYTFDIHRVHELHQEGRLPQWTHLAQLWRRKTSDEITSTPISTGATVAFASRRGVVVGVNAVDKKPRFDFYTEGRIKAPLGQSADLIFAADENGRMFCINQDNGQLRWSYSFGAQVHLQPKAVDGQLFALPHRRGMECLSTTSGIRLWIQPRANEFVAASETRVYASDISGNLLILNRQDGSILAALPMRPYSVRISNDRTDRILLSTPEGLIVCLREQGAEFPAFHLYPERQPILPDLAPEDDPNAAPAAEPAAN